MANRTQIHLFPFTKHKVDIDGLTKILVTVLALDIQLISIDDLTFEM